MRFSAKDCGACAERVRCTNSKSGRREIRLEARAQHEALEKRREAQKTPEFQQRYQARAGIEGTREQAIRRTGLRLCRYVGLAKAHLQHVLTALAINCLRIANWWEDRALAPSRKSAFAKLRPAMAS